MYHTLRREEWRARMGMHWRIKIALAAAQENARIEKEAAEYQANFIATIKQHASEVRREEIARLQRKLKEEKERNNVGVFQFNDRQK